MAERVFRVVGRPDAIDDPRFKTNAARVRHRDEVDGLVAEWVAQRTQEEALQVFEEADVTAGAAGAVLALIIAFIQRRLNFQVFRDSLVEAISATGMPNLSASGQTQSIVPSVGQVAWWGWVKLNRNPSMPG